MHFTADGGVGEYCVIEDADYAPSEVATEHAKPGYSLQGQYEVVCQEEMSTVPLGYVLQAE